MNRLHHPGPVALGCTLLAMAAAAVAASAAQPPFKPVIFQGRAFDCVRYEKISLGAGAYFTPGRRAPDASGDALIFNYYTTSTVPPLTEEGAAAATVQRTQSLGGNIVAKFRSPDPLDKSVAAYFVYFVYIYPAAHDGDVWMTKYTHARDTVVGVAYKHRVAGADTEAIAASAKDWLVHDGKATGLELGSLAIPGLPSGVIPSDPAPPNP
jgi:hypothetical protein